MGASKLGHHERRAYRHPKRPIHVAEDIPECSAAAEAGNKALQNSAGQEGTHTQVHVGDQEDGHAAGKEYV